MCDILTNGDLNEEISRELIAAEIFIALVSPDYLNSNYCYEIEFAEAQKRKAQGKIIIVPVIAQPCDWHSSPFGKMKVVPKDGKAIADWTNENATYLNVIQELCRLLEYGAGDKVNDNIPPKLSTVLR